jgi:serine/threonine protein kinase
MPMPAPSTSDEFLDLIRKSGVLEEKRLDAYLEKARAASTLPSELPKLAGVLVRDGILTHFQAEQFLQGKWRRFTIGKYKVLERIGSGGMGSVYLCEHKLMRRRVAVKVLPTAKAEDTSSLERFYREARAVAALDHVNIVRAYDIDQDDKLHFLVMEYVDGSSLQEIVKRVGPLDPIRAAHYVRQAALGLQHAHEIAGLVHRDIKPGNILVDRVGTVKVLDMGLARFFHDEEDVLTKKYDENVLGTADYLAPEQALDSHSVDIRADIYSLGATFYYCLTARSPFNEGSVAQKLIWHQTRQPKPIRSLCPAAPEELVAVIDRMMAKDPAQRYQTPQAVADVLEKWTQQPIAPPPEEEMPRLSPAAMGMPGSGDMTNLAQPSPPSGGMLSPAPRKNWQVPASPTARPTAPPETSDKAPADAPTVPARAAAPAPTRPASAPVIAPARSRPINELQPVQTPVAALPPARPPAGNGNLFTIPRPTAPPAPEPIADDEAPPWEQLSVDTADLTARADTAPRSAHKGSSGRRSSGFPFAIPADLLKHRQLLLLLGVIGLFIALGVAAAIVIAILGFHKPPGKILTVGKDGDAPTIGEALKIAGEGDTILVREDIQECVQLQEKRHWNLRIEAENRSRLVSWSWPANPPDGSKQLLDVQNIEGLTVRGFIFDGKDQVEEDIRLSGNCPGLTLENLQIKGFTKAGVLITNCAGTRDQPVRLLQLTLIATEGQTNEAGVLFKSEQGKEPPNRYITVQKPTLVNRTGTIKRAVSGFPEATSNDVRVIEK